MAAFNEGRFADSADLFGKAESLVHAPTHLLYLARSQAKIGKYVKAREAYLKIIKEQLPASAPQAFRDAQVSAETEVKAVEPRIGKLTVKVEGSQGATELALKVDGEKVPAVLIGAPQPIDPGEHTIEVSATGKRSTPQKVKVGEGSAASVTLKLEDDPNYVAAAPVAAAGSAQPQTTPDGKPADSGPTGPNQGMRIGSYAAFGVGVAGLAVGTVFLLQKNSKESELDDLCTLPGGACPSDAKGLQDDANSAGTLAVVGYAVGGVGIAAGVTLFILSSKKSSGSAKHVTPHVTPWVGFNSAGVSGAF